MDAPEYRSFKKGARVEVCFNEVGFRGSWYTATIIETPSKKALKIFLAFDNLVEERNPEKPLREHVDFVLVRPVPPREVNRSFQLDEDVDAFHNDGWWEGVVTDSHPCSNASGDGDAPADAGPARYSVFFRSSREQIEFPASDLRLHREWVYGEWIPPLEEDAAAYAQLEPHQPTQGVSSPEVCSASSPTKSN